MSGTFAIWLNCFLILKPFTSVKGFFLGFRISGRRPEWGFFYVKIIFDFLGCMGYFEGNYTMIRQQGRKYPLLVAFCSIEEQKSIRTQEMIRGFKNNCAEYI